MRICKIFAWHKQWYSRWYSKICNVVHMYIANEWECRCCLSNIVCISSALLIATASLMNSHGRRERRWWVERRERSSGERERKRERGGGEREEGRGWKDSLQDRSEMRASIDPLCPLKMPCQINFLWRSLPMSSSTFILRMYLVRWIPRYEHIRVSQRYWRQYTYDDRSIKSQRDKRTKGDDSAREDISYYLDHNLRLIIVTFDMEFCNLRLVSRCNVV